MSRRVFATIKRGAMDNTAVCVFPWELPLLQHIHMQEVQEVSIDQMSTMKEGVVKIEKIKLKRPASKKAMPGLDLRGQFELMAYVNPDEDPANDPASEYQRLVGKYGMDREMPLPVVSRIYGEYMPDGAFDAKLREFAKDRLPKPELLKTIEAAEAAEMGASVEFAEMSLAELRRECKERGVKWTPRDDAATLRHKLEEASAVPA